MTESAVNAKKFIKVLDDFDRKTLYNHLNSIRSVFRKYFQTFTANKFMDIGTELDDCLKQELDCNR